MGVWVTRPPYGPPATGAAARPVAALACPVMTWGQEPRYAAGAPPAAARPPGRRRDRLRGWLLAGRRRRRVRSSQRSSSSVYYGATLGCGDHACSRCSLAALPLGIVIPTFLWLDRFEAEPTRYLVVAFLWGALVAALVAGVFNTGANIAFQAATGSSRQPMLATAVFSAPLVEEALKGLLVLLIWWFRRREFDGIIDGMVYAGIVAAGFAFTENIQYLGHGLQRRWRPGPHGHVHRPLPVHAVRPPDVHGLHRDRHRDRRDHPQPGAEGPRARRADTCSRRCCTRSGTSPPSPEGPGSSTVYLLVEVPIFVAFVAFVVWARRREGRLIGRYLSAYADAGWLSPSEVQMLSTMSGPPCRPGVGAIGRPAGRSPSMRGFQDTASELALLRARMHHSAADAQALETERELLDALTATPPGVPRGVLACRACAPSTSPRPSAPTSSPCGASCTRCPSSASTLPLTQRARRSTRSSGLDLEVTLGKGALVGGRRAARPWRRPHRRRPAGGAAARGHGRAAR